MKIAAFLLFSCALPALAQNPAYPILTGPTLPSLCPFSQLFFKTVAPGGLYFCTGNAWVSTSAVASGQITMILSGSCPFGFSEVTALDGVTVIGTLTAHSNVGTSGGSDSITPAGTVAAPNFTGTPLGTHTHTISGSTAGASSGTPAGTISAITASATVPDLVTVGSGLKVADTTHTHPAPTFTGTPPPAHLHASGTLVNAPVSAGTPAGNNSAPAFTGTSFDNRSAFVRVIFCSKD